MKNFIRIKNPVDKLNLENLSFDTLSLKARPILTDEEVKIFENFFARIPTTATATQSENIQKAKKNWMKKGVEFIYIGAESGSDEVLKNIEKGATRQEIIEAVKKIEKSGIKASVTFISGLGGKKHWKEHAVETGTMISEMGASYVGVLTLLLEESAPMYKDVLDGSFQLLSPEEVVLESLLMMENINVPEDKPCVFRSNHASNYVTLRGDLPKDKGKFLKQLKKASENLNLLKDERFRAL